jgi:hypothetical protein
MADRKREDSELNGRKHPPNSTRYLLLHECLYSENMKFNITEPSGKLEEMKLGAGGAYYVLITRGSQVKGHSHAMSSSKKLQ